MTQQLINVGSAPGDGTGDSLRTAGQKINANFTELYTNVAASVLPSKVGQAGNALYTDGFQLFWAPNTTTNAVLTTGNYSDPSWITALSYNKLVGAPAAYSLPVASSSVLGGVKVDGTTITINGGVISAAPSGYSLPTATTTALGGVKIDGSSIVINNGVISSVIPTATVGTSTLGTLGGVKVDGTSIVINNGVITAIAGSGTVSSISVVTANGFAGTVANSTTTPAITIITNINGILKGNGTSMSAAVAGTDYQSAQSVTGIVKSSGTTRTAAVSGTDYAPGTSGLATGLLKSTTSTGALSIAVPGVDYIASLPTATSSVLGVVKGDGSTVSISGGIISVPAISTIGAASGIATLGPDGRLTASQIPASLTGAVVYKGTWNASTNTPTLTNGSGTAGWEYAVTVGGTALGITFSAGDYVIYNGTTWQQIPGSTVAAAGLLTGTTLNSNIVNSSLTSVGTLTNLTVTNPINGSVTGNAGTVTSISGNTLSSNQITTGLGFTPIQLSSLSITTQTASGNGSLSYNNSTGVFSFTPPAPYSLPTAGVGSGGTLGGVKVDGTTITISGSGVISSASGYSLPAATTSALGGVIIPTVATSGITNSSGTIGLAIASTTQLGGVKVDGTTVTISGSGVISAPSSGGTVIGPVASTNRAIAIYNGTGGQTLQNSAVTIDNTGVITAPVVGSIIPFYFTNQTAFPSASSYKGAVAFSNADARMYYAHDSVWSPLANLSDITSYTLPTAGVGSGGTLGGVKVDGTTITINGGVITSTISYTLPAATTSALGGVIIPSVSTSGITNTTGTIGLALATTSQLGGVTVDGSTIIATNGNIAVATATTSQLGAVKPDGTTITISGGTISAVQTSGLQSRTTVQYVTGIINSGNSVTGTITAAKGYALYSIQVSAGAWVTVYTSSTAQSNDSSRSITTDPTPGSGVIAESISTVSTTTYFTPAAIGFNADGTVSSNMYLKVYNNSGSSANITVTLTILKLEI